MFSFVKKMLGGQPQPPAPVTTPAVEIIQKMVPKNKEQAIRKLNRLQRLVRARRPDNPVEYQNSINTEIERELKLLDIYGIKITESEKDTQGILDELREKEAAE